MKRFLLSALVLSQIAAIGYANELTLTFDGEQDAYGWTRQTTVNANELDFVPSYAFKEAGVDFKIENTATTGEGFALVNDGTDNSGILVYSAFAASTSISPQVTLTVPGGKITAVTLTMTGSLNNAALNALSIKFNDLSVDSKKDGNVYNWNWKNDGGTETVTFGWENKFYMRFIHSISVTYTEDLGGKKECGLSFNETSATGFIGEDFTAPTLDNPNNLPLTWTSTSEDVATVDAEGKVTIIGVGKTKITVSTVGNDEFASGSATYELQVIPTASNIRQLIEYAPNLYDKVKVCFPMTVTFANGSYAFVIDEEGNAGYICDNRNQDGTSTSVTTLYKVGDVIPAGWVASNATIYESIIWEGLPGKVTEQVEVEYPTVQSVSREDVDRVVILTEVTFDSMTASEDSKAFGTTPDGTTYEFQNTYGVSSYPAGTYNVTCVVRYSKRGDTEYFYLSPIKYKEFDPSVINSIENEVSETRFFNLSGFEVKNPGHGIYIKVKEGAKTERVVVK